MSVEARKRLFTVDEFHRMGEAGILDDEARLELWGGEIFEMPLPDIVVLKPRDDFYRGGHGRPEDALLLVEVADSSLRRDRLVKVPRDALAGIPEVWVLDVEGRRLEVYRDPSGDAYRSVTVLEPGDAVSPQAFADVSLAIVELTG